MVLFSSAELEILPLACTGNGNLMNVELFSNLLSRLAARYRRVSHVVPDVSCSIGTTSFACVDPAACSALALLSGVGIESIEAPLAGSQNGCRTVGSACSTDR